MSTIQEFNKILLNNFTRYIKEQFKEDPYSFEICATDFFCLKENIDFKKIVITKTQGDKGVDAIALPSVNNMINFYYLIQVSLGDKSSKSLEKFYESNPYNKFPQIIPKGSICKRVVLALGNVYTNDEAIIISGSDLSEMIFEVGIKYGIISSLSFNDEYINNVKERANMWRTIHNSKYENKLLDDYSNLLTLNLTLLKNSKFSLPQSSMRILRNSIENVMNITTTSIREKFLVKYKIYTEKYNKSKEDLGLLVGTELGFNRLAVGVVDYEDVDYLIKPTKRYLSIKLPHKNTAIAHLDWSYNSKNALHAIFGFKVPYNLVSCLNSRLRPIEEVNNPLNFKMNTALVNPGLKDGRLIKELITRSKHWLR